MIRPFGSAKQGKLSDEVARARLTLADAVASTEPDTFARAVVREAWRLVPVSGVAWLTVGPAGAEVGAQAPREVVRPDKLTDGIVRRALMSKNAVRATVKTDPALREFPASVLAAPMRSRGTTSGLLIAVREIARPFVLAEEHAFDALLRVAAEALTRPLQPAEMPPISLLRIDLFWAQAPTDVAREQVVAHAGQIIKSQIRPTDGLRRVDLASLEVSLLRPTPETPTIVSQRLHHALASRIVELHNARWSINSVDAPPAEASPT